MFEVYDNRSEKYISQTVPVKAGCSLRISLLLHDGCNCCAAWLVIRPDNGKFRWIPMEWSRKESDSFNWWTVEFAPEASGLYWYRFEFEGNWRRNVITCVSHGFGDITDKGTDWQLTVYDADFDTPQKILRRTYISDISRPLLFVGRAKARHSVRPPYCQRLVLSACVASE